MKATKFISLLLALVMCLCALASCNTGGPTGGGGDRGHGEATSTPEGLDKLTSSTVRLVEKYDLDGIDCDWEFPGDTGIIEEKYQHTALFADYRRKLDALSEKNHKRYWLTTAAGAGEWYLARTEIHESHKYLDFINRYNLKQIAQSVAYLEERDMLDRELLAQNAAAASDRFHELSEKIKGAETRMKEIAVLREHIRNYIKTRDTYVAYRKAGYSKKFFAEHESEVTLHKAAKKKFDELGVKKLPTLKSLVAEYARLLAEKKHSFRNTARHERK
jgi:hypothetical protein